MTDLERTPEQRVADAELQACYNANLGGLRDMLNKAMASGTVSRPRRQRPDVDDKPAKFP